MANIMQTRACRDQGFEKWLRDEAVKAYDEIVRDPSRAITPEQVLRHLRDVLDDTTC